VAALMIEPLRIAPFRHTVADERQPRRAQRDQFMRIYWNVAGRLSAERGLFGAVIQEVARHPVILAGAGEALDRLAPVASMELGSALARRPDEDGRESLIVGHRHERGLAETRDAFDPDLLRINRLICLEVVETPRRTPRPGAQRSPVIGMSRLSLLTRPM